MAVKLPALWVALLITFGFTGGLFLGLSDELCVAIYFLFLVATHFIRPLTPARLPVSLLLASRVTFLVLRPLPFIADWPLDFYIAAFVTWLVLRSSRPVDLSAKWSLKFSKKELASAAAIFFASALGLGLYFIFNRSVAQSLPVPQVATWSLPAVIVLAGLINALREELLFRLLYQRAFAACLSVPWAIFLQALVFGLLHFRNGFPQGWAGVGLTFLFGILTGVQFFWSRSFTLIWLTHAAVDAAMFGIILGCR